MSRSSGKTLLLIFGLIWCSITFLIDGCLAWNLVQQLRASNFPMVTGTVTHSELKVESHSEGDSYDADIRYHYVVSGQTHESTSICCDLVSWRGKEQAEALVRKYGVGKSVAVYYDPARPHSAVLELGPSINNLYAAMFFAPFNTVAFFLVGGLWCERRSKRLGRPIAGVSLRSDGLTTTIRVYERSPTFAAIAAWGGASLVAVAGVIFASPVLPSEYALALGWSATLAATFVAWRSARKKYCEIRLDAMRGRFDIRDQDGRTFSIAREDMQPVKYSSRATTVSDGDKATKVPVGMGYFDPEGQELRILTLPEQPSEEDAEFLAAWLNGLMQLPYKGRGSAEQPSRWHE